jgi:hypothetical protein
MAAACGAPSAGAVAAAAWALIVWAALQAGCLGAGTAAGRWVGRRFGRARRSAGLEPVTALVLGWLAAGLTLLGLAVLGLFRPAVLGALAVAGLAMAGPARGIVAEAWRAWRAGDDAATRAMRWIAGIFLAAVAVCLLAPETHIDALTYHLAIAGRAVRLGRLVAPPGNFLHHFPACTELLRGWGLALGGEPAARLWTLGGLVAGAAAIAGVVARTAGARWGWTAFALWAASPLAAGAALGGKPDAFLAPAMVAAVAWSLRGSASGALLAGLAAGLAAGSKLTALPLAAVVVGLASTRRRPVRAAALVLAGLAAGAGPWSLKSALLTGDPLYPFGKRGWGMSAAAVNQLVEVTGTMALRGRYDGWLRRAAAPWTATMTDGLPALWLALVPLALLAGGRAARPWWIVGWLGWIAWVLGPPQPRYAVVPLAWLTVAVVLGLAATGVRRTAAVLAGACLVLQAARTGIACAGEGSWGAGLGFEGRDAFLHRTLSTYAETMDRIGGLPPGARVVFAGEWRGWPAPRPGIVSSLHEPFPLLPGVRASSRAGDLDRRVRQLGATHLVHNPVAAMYHRNSQTIHRWMTRDLVVWTGWWRRHAVLVAPPTRVDPAEGGYFTYRLGRAHEPAPTPSLPGIEGLLAVIEGNLRRHDLAAASDLAWALESVAGDFPQVQAFLGQVWYADNPSVAAAYVRRAYAGGWLDLAGGHPGAEAAR